MALIRILKYSVHRLAHANLISVYSNHTCSLKVASAWQKSENSVYMAIYLNTMYVNAFYALVAGICQFNLGY